VLSVGIDAWAPERLSDWCGGTVLTSGRRGALLDVGTPGFVDGFAGEIGGYEPAPGWLGLIAPSGSVAGGDEPVPAGGGGGGGADPTAAGGTTNARIFAVDDDSIGGATGGMGAVDVTIRWGGGRSVAFSAWTISAAVGARTSTRSLIASVRFIAGNDDGSARGWLAPPPCGQPPSPVSITSVESSLSGAAVFSAAGAAGS
jgi:hypothetical protein